jgi:hypothetical protein
LGTWTIDLLVCGAYTKRRKYLADLRQLEPVLHYAKRDKAEQIMEYPRTVQELDSQENATPTHDQYVGSS